ncbi:MAG: hypothetical protein DSY91_01235 [Deltaproteobacteria bacterium]|nr:MAG: hypothetical protein DSY91_01235 [Deltaproteobacteria bacterium]
MTRKEEIVQRCMDIFSESGTEGLTMKAIAERVNISEPAIYRHFKNKQAVILAMINQIREELFKRVDEIARRPMSAMDKLYRVFQHHLFYLKERRGITIALLSESFFYNQPKGRELMSFLLNDYHERIREIIAVGIEKGEFSDKINPRAVSILFLGALQHLLTMFRLSVSEAEIDLLSEEVFTHIKSILKGGENT